MQITATWHVEPLDDLKPHVLGEGGYCKCFPRIEKHSNGSQLVIHNAWDGREFDEAAAEIEKVRT